MTWHRRMADSGWLHLGYLAANSSALLTPSMLGKSITISPRDRENCTLLAEFFDSAVAGLSSFEKPDFLFNSREDELLIPASSLELAVSVYRDLHGIPVASASAFTADLEHYRDLLRAMAEGRIPRKEKVSPLLRFLAGIIARAKVEMYGSLGTPR
jgi:hypothetical protein